jgi:XTP/dITP diphosphohydrolase
MKTKNVLSKIRALIAADDLSSAIEELQRIKGDELDDIILQSARHNDLKRQIRLAVIDPSGAKIEKNAIRLALLEIINEIEVNLDENAELKEEVSSHIFSSLERSATPALKFVSSNRKKYLEYKKLLAPLPLSFSNLNVDEIQNLNMEKVVREKVNVLKPIFGETPFFVDETALLIDDWNGLPGGMTDHLLSSIGSSGLCKMLNGFPQSNRKARAITVIGYSKEDSTEIFSHTIYGTISRRVRKGVYDFGWASIFIPDGQKKTYAEMGFDEKNEVSMRSGATCKFKQYLHSNLVPTGSKKEANGNEDERKYGDRPKGDNSDQVTLPHQYFQ